MNKQLLEISNPYINISDDSNLFNRLINTFKYRRKFYLINNNTLPNFDNSVEIILVYDSINRNFK